MGKQTRGREDGQVEVVDTVEKSEVAMREEAMQAFWVEHDIFNKSLEAPAGEAPVGDFVFYDGPPFATGLPHYGHLLAGTIKDAVPRFWTMNGYRVRRKWGWDCHGLPLENLIEKKLGLATKRDIEEYGVQNFNEQARDVVMEYADDWRKIIPRMGRFVDMEDDYKTMDSTYTESVWWVFKSLHEKGLVYEGFKSMHLCPRCGTTLSNFEVNQGYKDIKDIAVTVKLPLLDDEAKETDTSLLVWTTTPWTLPGNTAAAVNKDFDYVKVKVTTDGKKDFVILAKERLAQLGDLPYEIVEEFKGSELVGKKYKAPFGYFQDLDGQTPNGWKIWHADYVEIGDEGTGAVHIAPAYGEDDLNLAQANDVPIIHHVDEVGHFTNFVTDFAGQLVKPKDDEASGVDHKDADIEILKHLQAKGRIFKKENITHSYPHCWRCDTPLLNYATTSWFVEVTKIKDQLVAANDKVKWVPEHVGTNRFGKWLEGARDWAISRQRYWGAPLPIWKNSETEEYKIIGSLAELQEYVPKSGNQYFLIRHGESESNLGALVSTKKDTKDGLTEKGNQQVMEAIANLPKDVDVIIHSGLQRTRETAEIIAKKLGSAEVIEDSSIRELDLSDDYEGKNWSEYNQSFSSWADRYEVTLEGSENRRDVQIRMGQFIYSLDKKYAGKKILIVSHAGPLFALESVVKGLNVNQAEKYFDDGAAYFGNAEVRELEFVPIPHNDNYELDFHRPYIDQIDLFEDGVKLERVPDVFDCWFESGSMPYGQRHYVGEAQEDFDPTKDIQFPAQFIAESIDQTRGWFYSLMVIGVALFGKSSFDNVVTNGLVLAEDGRKMSKSLQNYPDPMELVARQGADSMRFYLLSSSIIKGEDLNFSEKEVTELQRKNIGRLHNVLAMYEMFADGTEAADNSDNVLDKWIISRLNQVVKEATTGYKNYELDKATRPITDFIDDLSVWYLRRSRERLKGVRKPGGLSQEVASNSDEGKNSDNLNSSCKEDVEDKTKALATLRHTLRTLALVMAPAMPFYAEYLWQVVRQEDEAESVHLAKWPEGGEVDEAALEEMVKTREVVTQALEVRTKSGIKVRQPIAKVSGPEVSAELAEVILEELNAKHYESGVEKVSIDTVLTPELLAEGAVRELMRAVQGRRKTEGLEPQDEIKLTIKTDEAGQSAITAHEELITKTVGASAMEFAEVEGETLTTSEFDFAFKITVT